MTTRRLHLSAKHRALLESLLLDHMYGVAVWAYGSRVNGRSHEGSDLDLVLRGPGLEKIALERLMDFEEAVRDSDIPFLVEARDWARLPERFRREIEREYVVVVGGCDERRADWPRSRIGDLVTVHKEQITPSSFHDNLFAHHSIPAYDDGQVSSVEPGSRIKSNKFTVPSDAVLVSRLNPQFPRVWSPDIVSDQRAICSTEFLVLRPGTLIDRRFLHHLCMSPSFRTSLLARVTGTSGSHQRVSPQSLLEIEVSVPPLPEQRAIAHILGTLDDKIELNRRMNETLEAMARALFKSWFVDFDPVRAKMEGRDTGLPQDIADLFPDRLVDSEVGEIPEGWEVKTLGDCMLLTMGQSPPGSTYNEDGDGLPFFQGRTDFGFRYPTNRRFCSAPNRIARPEDTLVSVRAPVGDINVAWERCCIGRGVAALRHRSGSASYTYHSAWAMQGALREYQHTGTVFGAINKGQFEALRMIEADPNTVDAFDSLAGPLDARIRSSVSESRALVALRDTLLPKLISGELRTVDAEPLVSSVSGDGPGVHA